MSSPVPPGGGDTPPDPRGVTCGSAECIAALAGVVAARGIITFKCGQVASARAWMNTLAAIAATLLGLAIAAFAAAGTASATIFGIPVGIVLFWIGVSLLATAILFGILAGIAALRVLVLEGELNQARTDFAAATAKVTTACPGTCWGDLTMPSC
jgi:hypothetical protein